MANERIAPFPLLQADGSSGAFVRFVESLDPIDLLNLASDAIIVCGIDRRINFWNAGAVAMYGWSVQEALGKNIHDLLKTKFPDSRESLWRTLLERGRWEGELTHISKNGRPIVVTSKHVLQSEHNGIPCRILEINRDITERKLIEEELKRSQSELEEIVAERTSALRRLSSHLLRVQDEERRKLARELHDSLGQYLTDAKIKLDLLAARVPPDDAEVLMGALQSVEQSLIETRTISHLLHPPLLDEAGLASAARWYVEGFAQRSGIEAKLGLPSELGRLPEAVELTLFRILQESLTNVHRHSSSLRVQVEFTRDERHVTLTVRDFGRGMPADALERFRCGSSGCGVGLGGMRERVNNLSGHLEIRSDGNGTAVLVSIPLSAGERCAAA
jgi:PAS domain S-box-containing protein